MPQRLVGDARRHRAGHDRGHDGADRRRLLAADALRDRRLERAHQDRDPLRRRLDPDFDGSPPLAPFECPDDLAELFDPPPPDDDADLRREPDDALELRERPDDDPLRDRPDDDPLRERPDDDLLRDRPDDDPLPERRGDEDFADEAFADEDFADEDFADETSPSSIFPRHSPDASSFITV